MKNIQKTFAIAIPTINRWDLLKETLRKYESDFPNTCFFIIDNGNQGVENLNSNINILLQIENNLGVSGSWNQMIKSASDLNFENVLVLNDDIYLGKTEEQVLDFLKHNKFSLATPTPECNWSAFIIPVETYKSIGSFDENFFPAYFEDNDYAYRLKLNGTPHTHFEFLNASIYRNSETIKKDPSLNVNFEKNKKYYIEKWGGLPGKETKTS